MTRADMVLFYNKHISVSGIFNIFKAEVLMFKSSFCSTSKVSLIDFVWNCSVSHNTRHQHQHGHRFGAEKILKDVKITKSLAVLAAATMWKEYSVN